MMSITQCGGCHGTERKEETRRRAGISSTDLENVEKKASRRNCYHSKGDKFRFFLMVAKKVRYSCALHSSESFLFENTYSLPSHPPLPPPQSPLLPPRASLQVWAITEGRGGWRRWSSSLISQGQHWAPLPRCPSPLPAHSKPHWSLTTTSLWGN